MWYVVGKLCGYPYCCILTFSLREAADVPSKFECSGFVPCNKCANHTSSFVLEYIEKNRDKRLHKFPNDLGVETLARQIMKGQ